ncbi:MAG TPA: hypothetical protein VLG36_01455 [Candidatus Chromulinivoraceae bacterium]|nr:hypothetical protein [Candidatus Chromulinivoraceae bacterium]
MHDFDMRVLNELRRIATPADNQAIDGKKAGLVGPRMKNESVSVRILVALLDANQRATLPGVLASFGSLKRQRLLLNAPGKGYFVVMSD